MAIAVPLTSARAAADSAVGAAPCSVAGGRDAGSNTIICNFGLTPEQLKQLTEAVVKGATEPLTHQIVDISKTLGVTQDAAEKLLKIVGEDPNIPEDKLAESLSKVAADYQRLQTQVAALNPDNPTAKALVEQAKPEIDAGHFQRAHQLLRQATQAQIAAAQEARSLREQAQAAEDAQMLGAASSTAAEGDVAMTERRYKDAEELFAQAASYVPSGHASDRGSYLLRQEDALFRQGDERGDRAALEDAAVVCKRALDQYPREKAASEWAMTQMSLGNVLEKLGERESGTAKLEEAVAAYRLALEERTRGRLPVDWASTQNNLGDALRTLGERQRGTDKLFESVAAFREALEEYTRERFPLDWAATQNNLGFALFRLGEREAGRAQLEEAVASLRAALEERKRDLVPFRWASTQNNLGVALTTLGEREAGPGSLEEAVRAFQAALKERTRERVPLAWAMTQNNLGLALEKLGERESGTARLEQAVAAFNRALEENTREGVPLRWGGDAQQSWRCAQGARRAGERDGAA
jgi:tetratricopeptide (TPR) repeat protein